ncbi:hypothetical protein OBBRIDRAFT_518940 [Obba rivulosa]|uniref:Secreted protein n=1 Tax=Obba rivulosa TaxID=1052685 RepID=A0A8E2AYM2_9APHY|nr:hypothetical protein OBBRIDRAFT_518940 [Obba rivulosa]
MLIIMYQMLLVLCGVSLFLHPAVRFRSFAPRSYAYQVNMNAARDKPNFQLQVWRRCVFSGPFCSSSHSHTAVKPPKDFGLSLGRTDVTLLEFHGTERRPDGPGYVKGACSKFPITIAADHGLHERLVR